MAYVCAAHSHFEDGAKLIRLRRLWISLAKPAATHLKNTWKLYSNAKKTIRLFQDTPLYPRTKGFIATVKKLGVSGRMQAAHDLALAYTHHDRFFEAPTI